MTRFIAPGLIAAVLMVLIFSGCASEYDPNKTIEVPAQVFNVIYTYPIHSMREVPLTSSLIIHYSKTVDPRTQPTAASLKVVNPDQTLTSVPLSMEVAGQNLIIKPNLPLEPLRHYELTVSADVRGANGEAAQVPAGGTFVAFDTGAERPLAGIAPYVTTVLPDPGTNSVFDFQTYRVYFSEPLDQRSVKYGETVGFINEDGELVQGNLFTSSSQIVFDPDGDLHPGDYALTIKKEIQDAGGESMEQDASYTFHVISSYPHADLLVENCPTTGKHSSCTPTASADLMPASPYTNQPSNSMLVNSFLLGSSKVFVSGQLQAEMGNAGKFSSDIPLVIRKGQKLHATAMNAKLGGAIPTGLNTGEITIQVLTDSVGFLSASEKTGPVKGAPAALSLTLDAAMTTSNEVTNAMMAQTILGAQLFGTAFVENGVMIMQIAGFAEIFVLGERMATEMSLEMHNAGAVLPVAQEEPPMVMSVSPSPGSKNVRLGDPITVVFNKPVSRESAEENIILQSFEGNLVSTDLLINGPKVQLIPEGPLEPDTSFVVVVQAGMADTEGLPTSYDMEFHFLTGAAEYSNDPPVVGTTNPGSKLSPLMPGHLPLEVFFDQIMDPDTIELGDTFIVMDASDGNRPVPGTLVKSWYRFTFYPNEPFISTHAYRVLLSGEITNFQGIRLDADRNHEPGGYQGINDVEIVFSAMERNHWVPLVLGLDPLIDRDGSGYIDGTERKPDPDMNYFKINFPLIPQPSYASGYMVSYVRGLDYDQIGQPFMDISLIPGNFMFATSTQIDLSVILGLLGLESEKDLPNGFLAPMGRIYIDELDGFAPTVEGPHDTAQMNISMLTYFSLDNAYINYSLVHQLALDATGDLSFTPDGKMAVDINGNATMTMNLTIPIIDITIPLPLPVLVSMRTTNLPAKDWWNEF